jgi:hypothetical protein
MIKTQVQIPDCQDFQGFRFKGSGSTGGGTR